MNHLLENHIDLFNENVFESSEILLNEIEKNQGNQEFEILANSFEAPFVKSEYESNSTEENLPLKEAKIQFWDEIYDQEFENALSVLSSEVTGMILDNSNNEFVSSDPQSVMIAKSHLENMAYEIEKSLSNLSSELQDNELDQFTPFELETIIEKHFIPSNTYTPAQELFFKKIKDKVKNVVSGIKKVVNKIGKIIPIQPILNKLKTFIKPLVNRVLQTALNKLPENLQPIAKALLDKLFHNKQSTVVNDDIINNTNNTEENNNSVSNENIVEMEFDAMISNLVFQGEDRNVEQFVHNYVNNESITNGLSNSDNYSEAKFQLTENLKQVNSQEEANVAIQQFIPAIIPVIKMAISIIGRQKIVNFLGKGVNTIISNLLKNTMVEHHQALSNALVDKGMKLFGFELESGENSVKDNLVYEAFANVVEETLIDVASSPQNYELESNPEMLYGIVKNSFNKSISKNFPSSIVNNENKQTNVNSTFFNMPLKNKRKKYYQKYSEIFNVEIDVVKASKISTYKNQSLKDYLKDKYSIDLKTKLNAKMHIYRIIPGSTLSHISYFEKVKGLGSANATAWNKILPLDVNAATLLIGEPNLGLDHHHYSKNWNPNRIFPNQRYYYLEIENYNMAVNEPTVTNNSQTDTITPTMPLVSPSSDIQLIIDTLTNKLNINIYLSKEDCQSISSKIESRDLLNASHNLVAYCMRILKRIKLKNIPSKVRIIQENLPERYLDQMSGSIVNENGELELELEFNMVSIMINKILQPLHEFYHTHLYKNIQKFINEFPSKSKDNGITISVEISNLTFLNMLRTLINNLKNKKYEPFTIVPFNFKEANFQIELKSGKVFK